MPAFGVKLEPGFTTAQYRDALLSICIQAWGAYTLYTPQAGSYWMGHRNLEWPDINGRKHYWFFNSASNGTANIASERTGTPPNATYLNAASAGSVPLDPSNKSVSYYLIAIGESKYRILAIISSGSLACGAVGEVQGLAPYWGVSDRTFAMSVPDSFGTIPGLNPFGAIGSNGIASPNGRTTYHLNRYNAEYSLNPITGKREVRINQAFVDPAYGVMGYLPRDIGSASASDIATTAPVIYDCGEDGLFMSLPIGSTARWCVKVDAAPIAGLTVYPAALYDFGDPPEGVALNPGTGDCEPVRRLTRQIFPDPSALDLQQGTP